MTKKKTLKKQKFSLEDIQTVDNIDLSQFEDVNPRDFFKNPDNVALALFQALQDNDSEAYLEILAAYLRINKSAIAKKSELSRSTIHSAFSKGGNPGIKTIAKIVHYGFAEINSQKHN